MSPVLYGALMVAGIGGSLVWWARLARRDERLLLVYVAALAGAFFGAKVVYFLAEGWMDLGRSDVWLRLATGKSILGALLGGYASVELAKQWLGYRGVTGDWFAAVVPLGVALGRVGCLLHGCCPGRPWESGWFTLRDAAGRERWPAVPVELGFNLVALAVFYGLRRRQAWTGQHFHLYLMAYGVFRFGHEWLRDTPRVLGSFSGYQVAALGVAILGAIGFWGRRAALERVELRRDPAIPAG